MFDLVLLLLLDFPGGSDGKQSAWPAFWEICMQVNKQQLEPDMEQQIGSNLGKEYVKTAYYQPSHLTYM